MKSHPTYLWVGRFNSVKMSIPPKTIFRCSAIPIKIPKTFLTVTEKSILSFTWNHKGPWIGKTILKEEQNWNSHTSWFPLTTKLQSSKQCGTGIKRDTYTKEIESKNKPLQMWSNDFWQKMSRPSNREKTAFSTNGSGKTRYSYANNEVRPLPNTVYKNQLKMDPWPKCKTPTYKKLLEDNRRQKPHNIRFLGYDTKGTDNKRKK